MNIDERVLAAYMANSSKTAIAKALGVSRTTLHKWEKQPEFQVALKEYKRQVLNSAVNRMQNGLDEAISVLLAIIHDENIAPQTRLNAVSTLLVQHRELLQSQEFSERLDALEQAVSDNS